jgi:hypothetical protein
MRELAFLSPDQARPEGRFTPRPASPLARALAGSDGIRDLSLLGKLELRGEIGALELGAEVIRITPSRTLVIGPPERIAALRESLHGVVIEVTAALAGIELESSTLMRRLTDLDLGRLPAVGKVAGVPAVVSRGEAGFRIFFPQEYGDSVVAIVRDLMEGLR